MSLLSIYTTTKIGFVRHYQVWPWMFLTDSLINYGVQCQRTLYYKKQGNSNFILINSLYNETSLDISIVSSNLV